MLQTRIKVDTKINTVWSKKKFKAFYSDQAFWNFSDNCSTFFQMSVKKDWVLRFRYNKQYDKKFNLWVSLGCRLDCKLFLDHPIYFCLENVFPFLTLGFVYLFTNPNIITAKLLFRLDHPYLHDYLYWCGL